MISAPDIKTVEIEYISPRLLSPHPRNMKIYGDEDVAELRERILASKWIKPLIVTPTNRIISGHRRWRVACSLGWDVPVERRSFSNEIEEVEALLLENEARDKTVEQRAREGETWEEIYRKKAEQTQFSQGDVGREHGKSGSKIEQLKSINGSNINKEHPLEEIFPQGGALKSSNNHRAPQTRDKVAAQVGLGSGKTYEKAKEAVKAADKLEAKGRVEEANALRQVLNHRGKGNVQAAAKVALMPEEKQVAVLEKLVTGEVKTIKAAELELEKEKIEAQAQIAPTKPSLTLASWDLWLPLQPQCDLLITDPPYSTDVEDIEAFARVWLPVALSKVKPTGRAYICIGAYPHELRAYLSVQGCMSVRQILVWSYENTLGPSPSHDYKQNWQAILYFSGDEAPLLDCPILKEQFTVQHLRAPDGRLGDRYHTWQKPDELAERLIRHSTKPGDTVLDCFAGTGTFLLAAHRLGRVACGCDNAPEMTEIATTRGCEVTG